eukprot:3327648-Amphidinium_carterae.1
MVSLCIIPTKPVIESVSLKQTPLDKTLRLGSPHLLELCSRLNVKISKRFNLGCACRDGMCSNGTLPRCSFCRRCHSLI